MCCIVYLDDVLIYSNTLQQHRKDVSNILEAIRKSGMKAKPLYAKTKNECIGKWEWGDKEQQAFDELRTKLTTAPVLVYFDPLAPTKMGTDSTKYICSGILSQQCQDGKWRPVAYQSKTMSDAECNNDIHEKKLLTIVQAFYE